MRKQIKLLLCLVLLFGVCQSVFAVTPQTGWWWNPTESGRGFAIEQQGNTIFFAAYLYRDDGSAVWHTAVLEEKPDSQYEGELEEFQNGQTLTGEYVKPESIAGPGEIVLNFTDSTNGSLTLPSGTVVPISRFRFSASNQVRLKISQKGDAPEDLGDIIIKLDVANAPITTENFLQYVKDGFYDGTIIHRVIPDFVIQGGGFLPGLVKQTGARQAIQNEASNGLKNTQYTIAMALQGDNPQSATSEFFFNIKDNTFLDLGSNTNTADFGFTVFGEVTEESQEVLDKIAATPTTTTNNKQDVPIKDVIIEKAEVVN
ncbi:MAG: peptidylprolyl isomerase [Methylococcales bacterium]